MTITATLVKEDGEPRILDDIPVDQTTPGIISSRTKQVGDITTTITTTLVPVEGVPEEKKTDIASLKDENFPGFHRVDPDNIKPCIIATKSEIDGRKTTTVTLTEIDESKKPDTVGTQFMQNIPPSITFNIMQTGIYGFNPLPVQDAESCVIANKTVSDGEKTLLISSILREIPEENVADDGNYPQSDGLSTSEAKPGIVISKSITGDNNKTIDVTSSLVVEEDREHPVHNLQIENKSQDKPGIVTSKRVNIDNKPTEIITTIVPLKSAGTVVIDPKETSLSRFYDVPTDGIKPCYVTVTEGKDETITATITTTVVTDQDLGDTGIILSSDKKTEAIEPEETNEDITTTVTTTTTRTTEVVRDEDKADGIKPEEAAEMEPEVGISLDGGGNVRAELDLGKPAEESEQIITTIATTVTTEDRPTDILQPKPNYVPTAENEVCTGKGDGNDIGINDFDQTAWVPTVVEEQHQYLVNGEKVCFLSPHRHNCLVLDLCLQSVMLNNVYIIHYCSSLLHVNFSPISPGILYCMLY